MTLYILHKFATLRWMYVLYLGFGKDCGESSAWAAAKSTVYDLFILLIGFLDRFLSKAAWTSLDPNPEDEVVAAIGELWLDDSPVHGANPRSTDPPVSDLDFLNRCHWLLDGLSTGWLANLSTSSKSSVDDWVWLTNAVSTNEINKVRTHAYLNSTRPASKGELKIVTL